MTLLATGMIAMGLASCSGRGSDNVSSSDDGDAIFNKFDGDIEQNVTLHILENDTAKSLGYLDELLNDFNAAYADKGIKAVDANIDQYTDLAQDGPAGYGPDLIYQANDMIMKNVAGHHILPLPIKKIEEESELPEEAAKAFRGTVNGKTYTFGAPVNIQAPFLFYRKDMLPEDCDKNGNGVPDMIESWNNLYSYSQAIKAQGGTKRGYMKALYDVYFSGGFVFSYGGYVFGNNGTDPNDIGFNKGESYKGAREIRQLASVMDKTCSDTSINTTCYSKIAQGEFFATMTTPDVKNNFINEMANQYETAEGLSKDAALQKAKDNLVIADLPKLPSSGDLTEDNPTLIDMKTMGGINGYAISSYTKAPKACLAFLNFATSYDMIMKRSQMMGIAPCRDDAVKEAGGLSGRLFSRLTKGDIYLMPSITQVAQIWTPAETLNKDLAMDPYRPASEQKYTTDAALQKGLDKVVSDIAAAISTLQ